MECETGKPIWHMNSDFHYERVKAGVSTIYNVGKKLGKGGKGIVFSLIPYQENKKEKAVKFIFDKRDNEGKKRNLKWEYEITQLFGKETGLPPSHKAFFSFKRKEIVIGEENIFPKAAIIMARYEGSLKALIPSLGKEEQEQAIKQILKGVAFLHKNNIVHRDLICANIFYRKEHDGTRYDISDFDSALSSSHILEQRKRIDLECLAILFKEILTRNIFGCRSVYNPQYDIKDQVVIILEKMENQFNFANLTIEDICNEFDKIFPLHISRDKEDPFSNLPEEQAAQIGKLRESAASFRDDPEMIHYFNQLIETIIEQCKINCAISSGI